MKNTNKMAASLLFTVLGAVALAPATASAQERDAKGFFQSVLRTGSERRVDLQNPLPVHLAYFTAWVDAKGRANYRRDVYGRDGRIFAALSKAGVTMRSVRA